MPTNIKLRQKKQKRRPKQSEMLVNSSVIAMITFILYLNFSKLDTINKLPSIVSFLLSLITLYYVSTMPKAVKSAYSTARLFLLQKEANILDTPEVHYNEGVKLVKYHDYGAAFFEFKEIPVNHKLYPYVQDHIICIGNILLSLLEGMKDKHNSKSSEDYYPVMQKANNFIEKIAESLDDKHRGSFLENVNKAKRCKNTTRPRK